MGMPKNYRELDNLRRGMEIIYRGIRTRCVYIDLRRQDGIIVACFENGLVLTCVDESGDVLVYEKPFHEAKPEF